MAMQKGKYLSDAILNVARGTAFPTVPANLYLAAFTTMPTAASGTGAVEPSGNGYARVALATATATWGAPATQGDNVTEKISSSGAATFPTDTTANWGSILGVGLYDALTAGNLWWYGTLNAPVTINVGNQLSIPASDLTIQEA